jgi:hypothetical protein
MNFITDVQPTSLAPILAPAEDSDYEGMSDYEEPKIKAAPKKKLNVKRYRYKADEPCLCEAKRSNAKNRKRSKTGKFEKDAIVWKPAYSFW